MSYQPAQAAHLEEATMGWTKARKLRFLHEAPVIRVATVGPRGRPHVTPVCPVESAGKIYWASDTDTAKLANIARHPSVALVADTYKADWRQMGGVMAQGRARIIKEGVSSGRSAASCIGSSGSTNRTRASRKERRRSSK
jgi:nitroimidazol reductase NimA-like FMN-containing flavoprotein (pyridoxamine 5'-phosphate oxidase superfamily)